MPVGELGPAQAARSSSIHSGNHPIRERARFLQLPEPVYRVTNFGESVMRVKAQISASVRVMGAVAMAISLFASGPALSASGQAQAPPSAPQPARPLNASAAPTVLKITPDEAVRMALENNLGVKADRLGPQFRPRRICVVPAASRFLLPARRVDT